MIDIAAMITELKSAIVCATAIPVNPIKCSIKYRQGSKIPPCRSADMMVAKRAFPLACKKFVLK